MCCCSDERRKRTAGISEKVDPVYKQSALRRFGIARRGRSKPGELTAEATGYRVRLSLEKSKTINPYSMEPIDALVIWDRKRSRPRTETGISASMTKMQANGVAGSLPVRLCRISECWRHPASRS